MIIAKFSIKGVNGPCCQTVNISDEAYNEWVSKDNVIPHYGKKQWANMSKKQKIEAHLKDYCDYLGGSSYIYEILKD